MRLPAVTAALAAAGLISSAQAQIQVAGELFVDVNATALPEGTLLSITNNGTLGGSFEAPGALPTIPNIGLAGGTRGMRFDGSDFLQLFTNDINNVRGLVPAPAGLLGGDSRTVEVWALNPAIADEETMVSWARRGGPDGSNVSFNYGQNGTWGAVGHWGAPDIGWNNTTGNAPARAKWHHLVYSYDGSATRVYSDGVLANMEVLAPGAINTAVGAGINLAAQFDNAAGTVTGGLRGSLALGRVRIHDGVLSDAQVLNNYNFEKPDFIDSDPTLAFLSSPPVHRYSFSEPATNDASGLTFHDSIGTAHGLVQGSAAQFNGSRLILPGGLSTTNAYGDLPNGLLSINSTNNLGTGEVSLEAWIKVTGSRAWARIIDFGSRAGGEVTGPGGTGNGLDYLFYSAQVNTDTATHRLELANNEPAALPVITADVVPVLFNTNLHLVVAWKESTGRLQVYENGVEVISTLTTNAISEINDVNVWLGRSQFAGDQNMQGEFDEFRIYNRVLSPREVNGNFLAGPDTVNTGAQPVGITTQPQDVTVLESYSGTFSVGVSGTPPLYYQWSRNGTPIGDATNATYSITPLLADSGATFSVVVSNFANSMPRVITSSNAVLTVVTQAITLKHRYSFGETAGTTANDSAGGAHGELRGGASFSGDGKLILDGSTGYINLPNDLVTNFVNITIESWINDTASLGWARIFDFGNSSAGEDFAPGTPNAAGTQYMFLSQPSGLGNLRGAYTIGGGGAAEQLIEWNGNALPKNQLKHVAWVSSGPAHTGRLFVDGVQVGQNTAVTLTPATLGPTANNWLGRAQFNDPFFNGSYDEFRIWDGAMTPAQVAASFATGPEAPICGVCLVIAPAGGNQVTISWPSFASDYFLECSAQLGPGANWLPVNDPVVPDGDRLRVTVTVGAGNKFYRLSR